MAKIKYCSVKDCGEEVAMFPGSTIKKKFCREHSISEALRLSREQTDKAKQSLLIARQSIHKGQSKTVKTPHQRAMDRADEWFSRYIRFYHSVDLNGTLYCHCYTCGKLYQMMAMDCGHWQKRENITTRFHPDNARPQCTVCNDHHKGEYAKFEAKLIDEFWPEKVQALKYLATVHGENNEQYCREQADKYRNLCNELFKERRVKNPWTEK